MYWRLFSFGKLSKEDLHCTFQVIDFSATPAHPPVQTVPSKEDSNIIYPKSDSVSAGYIPSRSSPAVDERG